VADITTIITWQNVQATHLVTPAVIVAVADGANQVAHVAFAKKQKQATVLLAPDQTTTALKLLLNHIPVNVEQLQKKALVAAGPHDQGVIVGNMEDDR